MRPFLKPWTDCLRAERRKQHTIDDRAQVPCVCIGSVLSLRSAERRWVFKGAMHGKLSISLRRRRRGIFARSRNWNGAIPIPQVYLNLGSALCRLDPSLPLSLSLPPTTTTFIALFCHCSARPPAPVRSYVPRSPSVRHGRHFWRERGRPTDRPTTAVVLGEISNLYSAHQSDSSCWQWHKRKKARFREDDTTDRQTEAETKSGEL